MQAQVTRLKVRIQPARDAEHPVGPRGLELQGFIALPDSVVAELGKGVGMLGHIDSRCGIITVYNDRFEPWEKR